MEENLILLSVLGYRYPSENSKRKYKYGLYKCFCGTEFITQINSVKNKNTKSCGCIKFLGVSKHNSSKERIYHIWHQMISRCNNKNHLSYKNYGGRGILICDEWKNNFLEFKNWAIENGFSEENKDISLDRIDNDGNYSPFNCRWVSKNIQSRNRRCISSKNTSGYRGVSYNTKTNKWISYIMVDGIQIYLGSFDSALEGAIKYNEYVTLHNLEHTKNKI